ncbi:HAD-IB family phosphatase [Cardiobacteriaceae bacterium TAE3-ERU3]|nr:HAD-IB family phosphatase [Cardiobacteriaceae bacterium TAE3-ERU3]
MKLDFQPDGVLFDCDSTLSTIEGIDELAAHANCRAEIAAFTDRAMNGEVPLEAVYSKRLDIIHPHRDDITAIAQQYLDTITTGAAETIAALQSRGIKAGIISGGLRDAILPLASRLGIAADDVHAVELDFDDDGNYRAVKPSPLTTADGKHEIAAAWKARHNLSHTVLIGDGASDVAALGGVDAVIGYGGVISRANVEQTATLFYREQDLRGLLPILGVAS